jgi:filamentous hemagglutinin family protein
MMGKASRTVRTLTAIGGGLAIALAFGAPVASGAAPGMPAGASIVAGQASVTAPSETSTLITQSSQKALINWQSFGINAGSSVTFQQPNSASITLNRVIGSGASAINGNLFANGQVWLINGNGILFGQGARIDVGGLIATTSDIKDADFLAGNYNFGIPGNPNASIINQGSIKAATGGSAVLSGSRVVNQGVIEAKLGKVVLGGASAFSVDFDGDNLIRYAITAPVSEAPKDADGKPASELIANSGTIAAEGGKVLLTARAARNVVDNVINSTGIIEATTARIQNGEIVLDAGDGTLNVAGTLDASGKGAGENGGTVKLMGGTVTVADGAKLDASGDAGGGSVLIGGNLRGVGPDPIAGAVAVGRAGITVDAITAGDGGTAVVFSQGETKVAASISAKGGAKGGNGGTVETSGHDLSIAANAKIDTTAAAGATGIWLLDPADVDVVNSGGSDLGGDAVAPSAIANALATTNVQLTATNDITIIDPVNYTSANSLTFLADHDVLFQASVQNAGTGAILADAGNTVKVDARTASGIVAVGSAGGTTTITATDLEIDAGHFVAQLGYHGGGGGDIVVDLTGDLSLFGGTTQFDYAQLGNGHAFGNRPAGGNVAGNITINAGGVAGFFSEPGGGSGWLGNAAGGGFIASGNVTLIAGDLDVTTNGFGLRDFILADIGNANIPNSGGDFTLGLTNPEGPVGPKNNLFYNSTHDLTLATAGDLQISASVENANTGNIIGIAGWDGVTDPSIAALIPGAYGNGEHSVIIGGALASGDVAVGSKFGTITVASGNLEVDAENGYAQLGYHGQGVGDIHVSLTGDLSITGGSEDSDFYAQIGNGNALGGDSGIGFVSGDIDLSVAGTTYITDNSIFDGGLAWIGNVAADGGSESGNVSLFTGNISTNGNDGEIGASAGAFIAADLAGGEVTIAVTNPDDIDDAGPGILLTSAIEYSSDFNFDLAVAGSIDIQASIQNAGSGAISVVGGWDGFTDPASAAFIPGAYGNGEDSTVTIGGASADDDVAVGTQFGTTTLSSGHLVVDAENGYAQLGFHGEGQGDITVSLTGHLSVSGGDGEGYFGQIGNGGLGVSGIASGDITVNAEGMVTLSGGSGTDAYAEIGHGGEGVESGVSASGAITVTAGDDILLTGGSGPGTYAQIGHGGNGSSSDNSGDITVQASGDVVLTGGFSSGAYALIGHGGENATGDSSGVISVEASGNVSLASDSEEGVGYTQIGHSSSTSDPDGDITVDAGGDVTLAAGADSAAFAQIGHGGLGSDAGAFGGITVTAGGNVALTAAGSYAQIGHGGASSSGGNTGDIFVQAIGDVKLTGGNNSGAYAQIGHGGANGAGSNFGDITVQAFGDVTLTGGFSSATYAQIGHGGENATGDSSGVISVQASGDVSLASDSEEGVGYTQIGHSSSTSDPDGDITVDAGGDVTLAAGADSAAFAQIGHGGLGSDAGAFGGITVTAGGDVALTAAGAYAQIGHGGANSGGGNTGDIFVQAIGDISLTGGYSSGAYAQIGHGGENATGDNSGLISVEAFGDLSLIGGSNSFTYAQIGHGAEDNSGNSSGDIDVRITGTTLLDDESGNEGGLAWIGNVAAGDSIASGNVTLITGDVVDDNQALPKFVQADLGDTDAGSGGNVVIGYTDSEGVNGIGAPILYDSPHDLTFASAGDLYFGGSVQNSGSGNFTAIAGWNGFTDPTIAAFIPGAYGNNDGTVTIGSAFADGDIAVGTKFGTMTVASDNLLVGASGGYAQLGFHGGGFGDIHVTLTGDLQLLGGERDSDAIGLYAQIGNGDATGEAEDFTDVGGNIDIKVAGTTHLDDNEAFDSVNIWIGNVAGIDGVQSGDISLITGDLKASGDPDQDHGIDVTDTNNEISRIIDGNIEHGNFTLGLTETPGVTLIDQALEFTSPYDLTILSNSTIHIANAIQNSGSGNITVAAGWNSDVAPEDVVLFHGYGENNASVIVHGLDGVIGGDSETGVPVDSGGGTAVGSKSGTTTIAGGSVALFAADAFAQIGYHGGGATGAIQVLAESDDLPASVSGSNCLAAGNICVSSGGTNGAYAQIGHLGLGTSGKASGGIDIHATGNLILSGGGPSVSSLNGLGAGTVANAYAQLGHGDASFSSSDDVSGDITVNVTGETYFGASATASSPAWIGNVSALTSPQTDEPNPHSGNVTIRTGDIDESHVGAVAPILASDLGSAPGFGGDVTIAITNDPLLFASDVPLIYTSPNDFTLLTTGNIVVPFTVQNQGTGGLALIAGWNPALSPENALVPGGYGNSNASVTIGGASAAGNVAVGSAGGTTTIASSDLLVQAVNGYAEVGHFGSATGAIVVRLTDDLTLSGGSSAGQFAQIGHGGENSNGSNSGSISVVAAGDVALNGGSGSLAYAQIGHGGAETNVGATSSYSQSGAIQVTGSTVTLAAGAGTGSYSQIGNGGFESGKNLGNAAATIGGSITVASSSTVTLTGNGTDAYAQIGNGGGKINSNSAAGASGVTSGDIIVTSAVSGSVTMTAGSGTDAYTQIGNGGVLANTPTAAPAGSFTISGHITVADLAIHGGNSGSNAYGQIGNGDGAHSGTANVSGDIAIVVPNQGSVTLTNGTASSSSAGIGNGIGTGTVTGTVTGFTAETPPPPPPPEEPSIDDVAGVAGVLTVLSQSPAPSALTDLAGGPPPGDMGGPVMMMAMSMGMEGTLESQEEPAPSDAVANSVGNSLSGAPGSVPSRTIVLLGGLLRQTISAPGATTPRGVPPADQDYSSWGNEAFWQ